jgi:hypothetical protein
MPMLNRSQQINLEQTIGEGNRMRALPNSFPAMPARQGSASYTDSSGKTIERQYSYPAMPERPIGPDILAGRQKQIGILDARAGNLSGNPGYAPGLRGQNAVADSAPGMFQAQQGLTESQAGLNQANARGVDAGIEGFKKLQTDYADLQKRFATMEAEFKKMQGGPAPMTPHQQAQNEVEKGKLDLETKKWQATTQPSGQPQPARQAPQGRAAAPLTSGPTTMLNGGSPPLQPQPGSTVAGGQPMAGAMPPRGGVTEGTIIQNDSGETLVRKNGEWVAYQSTQQGTPAVQ